METTAAVAYYPDYPGYLGMKWHDAEEPLRRWFDNYRLNRYAFGPSHNEWMTIEEVAFTRRGRRVVRYVGTIGADHHNERRTVLFETGAPPPPTFMIPIKEKYVPPEPTGYAERMRRRSDAIDTYLMMEMMRRLAPQQRFVAEVLPPVTPPPPKYRRNI